MKIKGRMSKIFLVALILTGLLMPVPGAKSEPSSLKTALIEIKNINDVPLIENMGFEILQTYDAYVLVGIPKTSYPQLSSSTSLPLKTIDYSLSFGSGSVSEEVLKGIDVKYELLNPGLYIVQLVGPATSEWVRGIKSKGDIISYIPNYGYIVKLRTKTSFDALWYIKGVYPYLNEWKLGASLARKIANSPENGTLRIAVYIDSSAQDPVSMALELSQEYGIKIENHPNRIGGIIIDTQGTLRYKFYGTIEVRNIKALLSNPQVLIVDYAPEMKFFNAEAAKITGVELARDEMLNGIGTPLTGSGQVVAIADTGLDTGNPSTVVDDFAGRVLTIYDAAGDGDPSDPDDEDLGGHGTHVAGSVAGSGVMSGADPSNHIYNGSFAGMAPEARIHFESVGIVTSQGASLTYDSITSMATRAYNDGARVWTNSWGSSDNSYTDDASEVDQFMWNHKDFLVLFAAGNDGPGSNTVGSPATAKNIITVGASENLVPHVAGQGLAQYSMADNPDQLAYFSSRGPTADGRIKPDLVAPGSGIVSVRATTVSDDNVGATWIIPTDSNGDGKFDYIAMQGTSMATPIAAGTIVLIRQYFIDYEGLSNPSAALIKATALVGTDILPGYEFGGYDQGWGRLDIAASLFPEPPLSFKYWDWQSVNSGGVWEQQIEVMNSTVPLRIVLTWTDYPGAPNSNPALVNDLNLVVVAPDGTEYHGNVFDSTSLNSVSNPTTYDSVNNVEVVRVDNPQVGTWTIKVIGYNIPQDDPDGPGPLDQTFAIAVRGGLGPQKAHHVKLLRKSLSGEGWTYKGLSLKAVRGDVIPLVLKVYNWGLNNETIAVGVSSNSPDIQVSLTPSGEISLLSGESKTLYAQIKISPNAQAEVYTVTFYASISNTPYTQRIYVKLAVMDPVYVPDHKVTDTDPSETMETTSSIAIDPTDGSIWIAYFRQNNERSGNPYTDTRLGNGDNFDLVIAHSTNGGKTWTEYIAVENFDRYYDYGNSNEQVIDWFYWYPQIEVDNGGKVYVAFSSLRHLYLVSGDENGFTYTTVEDASYSSSSPFRITIDMVFPWITIASTNSGEVWAFYTFRHYYKFLSTTDYRVIKYTTTSDGGSTWSNPASIESNPSNELVEYMPSAVYDGSRIWVFFAGKTSSESTLYLKYYTYDGSSWSGPTTLYSDSTVYFPSAFVDSSGRVWVAFYVPTGSFTSFNIYSWGLRLMYYDGSWHGPYTVDDYVTNSYPPAISEFKDKIWIAYSEASYYGGNSPKYNDKWPYSRYSIKVVAFDPSSETVTEQRYLSPGTSTNFHVDGDNDAHDGIYYSYTTEYDDLNSEVIVTAYTGNSYRFVWPTPMDKATTDVDWVKPSIEFQYPVDSVVLHLSGVSETSEYLMFPNNGVWAYNLTSLSGGSYSYGFSAIAIGETIQSPERLLIINTEPPSYVGSLINGDPSDWKGDEDQVLPGTSQIIEGILVWKDDNEGAIHYNMDLVKATADEGYLYMMIDPTDMANTGFPNNIYVEVLIDSNNDGTFDYNAVVDLSQYNMQDSSVRKLTLLNLETGENIGNSNTLFISSESNGVIELQIPRSIIGNPQGTMRIAVKTFETSGAGTLVGQRDVMTDDGNEYTTFDITNVPMFSSYIVALLITLMLVRVFRGFRD